RPPCAARGVRSAVARRALPLGRNRLGPAHRNAERGRRNAEQEVGPDSDDAGGPVPPGAGGSLGVPDAGTGPEGAAAVGRGARVQRGGQAWAAVFPEDQLAEAVAWQLLRRYGVVFRRVVTRETLLAPWRDLLRVYRRLEARGEVRGGRFVGGFSGEQYAL